MKKLSLLYLIVHLTACTQVPSYTVPMLENLVATHQKVAVLPFEVKFNSEFTQYAPIRSGKRNDASYWREQERLAGLDLQKTLFIDLAKQTEKGRLNKILQNFTETNKLLGEAGIAIFDLPQYDKNRLASILGVDAIISGTSSVEIYQFMANPFAPRQGGVYTDCIIYDGRTGSKIWSDEYVQRPGSQMDTPSRLASGTVRDFARNNPYIQKRR